MSTAVVNPIPLNGNGNGAHALHNGNGHATLTPLVPVSHGNTAYNETVIHSPTTHIDAFHQSSHNLAMVFSQVPWMKFSIVAQPDLVQLASNATLKGFVDQVTSITIATVSEQIHKEITAAVNQVIKNIAGTVGERMTTVHAGIMKEIISVAAQKTATDYERLAVPPFDQLLKDISGGNHHNCDCPPEITKPVATTPSPTKPTETVKPIETTKPIETIKPVETTKPIEPVKPIEPTKPVEPVKPIQPTKPIEPTKPVETPKPVEPTKPVEAPKPVEPTKPIEPAKPIETTKPAQPTTPAIPTTLPPPSLKAASWIWSPEYKKNPKPPAGHTRAFRRTIVTPSPVNALTLEIVGDDMYTVYVNGKLVGSGHNWDQPDRYTIRFESTSRVVVAVLASQSIGEVEVGLMAVGKVWNSSDANPVAVEFVTDAQWLTLTADGVSEKFIEPTFVDGTWSAAYVVAAYGAGPWSNGVKPTAPGKAAGQRISGVPKVPDAPIAPIADEWKF